MLEPERRGAAEPEGTSAPGNGRGREAGSDCG
jgi:hypothetical protein